MSGRRPRITPTTAFYFDTAKSETTQVITIKGWTRESLMKPENQEKIKNMIDKGKSKVEIEEFD